VKGRKRHVLVDTQGFLLKVVVSAANVPDRDGGRLIVQALRLFGPALPRLRQVWADAAYSGPFVEELQQQDGWEVEIVKRPENQHGFVVQAKRWIVERTFGWWQGCRRLAKDYEYQVESSEALIYVAMSQLMTRRLARLLAPSPG
jgi:putative transposase